LHKNNSGGFKIVKIITHRELTRAECAAIRKLVKDLCANYDHKYGCLFLNGECYMFGVTYTNTGICKYFRTSVLPIDPAMESTLTSGVAVENRKCKQCTKAFPANGKKAYCSTACASDAKKRQQRGYMRARRGES